MIYIYFTLILLLILGLSTLNISAKSQFLAPPQPQNSDEKLEKKDQGVENRQFPKQYQPPRLELLSKELWEGKNVIRLKVVSQALLMIVNLTSSNNEILGQ